MGKCGWNTLILYSDIKEKWENIQIISDNSETCALMKFQDSEKTEK